MEEKLLALLEKSRIFSPYSHAPKVKVSIEELDDYRFFICNCFGSNGHSFGVNIRELLAKYINSWAKILDEDPKKEFDWKEYSQNVFGFFDHSDWDAIYKTIEPGKNSFTFEIKANKSRIKFKRFGDILAFDILKNGESEHRTGLNALKALCRAEDPGNNQGIYELIHKVNVSISMAGQDSGSCKYLFDFAQVFEQLKVSLPKVEWSFDVNQLIENYLNDNNEYVVGECLGFKIYAALIHEEKGPGNSDYPQNVRIWRGGNLKHIKDREYQFENASDILLMLTMKSSLPDRFMIDPDLDSKFHTEQFRFAEVAAIFVTQLCSMQAIRYREIRAAIDNYQ